MTALLNSFRSGTRYLMLTRYEFTKHISSLVCRLSVGSVLWFMVILPRIRPIGTASLANKPATVSTRTLLRGIWRHLSRRRRIQSGLLLVVMLASGVAELVSLGAVLPFWRFSASQATVAATSGAAFGRLVGITDLPS